MNKDQDKIFSATDKFADALEASGLKSVSVFICYYDEKDESWCFGTSGNATMLEKVGALKMITKRMDKDL